MGLSSVVAKKNPANAGLFAIKNIYSVTMLTNLRLLGPLTLN